MSDVEIKTPDDGDGATDEAGDTAEEISPLAQVEAERDKLKDQLLRTAADFDNFRKRAKKDLELSERRGREEILRELLPVFDNLERAVSAGKDATDISAIVQGVEMVLKLFEDTASRLGLERLTTVGQRFDPALHDAFQHRDTSDHPPGTIVAELQAGYRLGDHLLRPAAVVVARKPRGSDED